MQQPTTDPAAARPTIASGVLRRALANAGLLLTGKGAAGLMQLATLALAARALGLEDFGLFSVMLAQIQLLVVLATFQSNQAVVRYGVEHLNSGDRTAFQKLIKFGTMLDMAAALAASVAAFLLAPFVAEQAGWDSSYVPAAQLLALLPLMNAISTPKGMLRLFGRFDLLARQVTATPLVRLVGTIVLAFAGGSLFQFAAVWIIAGAFGGLIAFALAWREARRQDLLTGMDLSLRGAARSNKGIWSFSIFSNLQSSFALLPAQMGTLIIGFALGPAAAGLMRVAQEIGTALAKPIELINQTVYPDVTRLVSASRWKRLRKLIARSGFSAFVVGALSTVLLFLAGETVIRLIFGSDYAGAVNVLLLISIATTIKVALFAAEPTLFALGMPARLLVTALLVDLVFVAVLLAAIPSLGILAAGLAYVASALTSLLVSYYWLATLLPRGKAAA